MEYVAYIFALALACAAGMEFVYLRFMEAMNRQHKRRIAELEKRNTELERELRSLRDLRDEQEEEDEETWPEMIEDDDSA
jgi:cell division protein FtsB